LISSIEIAIVLSPLSLGVGGLNLRPLNQGVGGLTPGKFFPLF
jgi:hypothetical protein